jgi:hypothetical protein
MGGVKRTENQDRSPRHPPAGIDPIEERALPIYQYVHSGAPLSILERDRLAEEIVRIHHSVTNAPEPFVRVAFQVVPLGMIYAAGETAPSVILKCQICAERTLALGQEILRSGYELIKAMARCRVVRATSEDASTIAAWWISRSTGRCCSGRFRIPERRQP